MKVDPLWEGSQVGKVVSPAVVRCPGFINEGEGALPDL